MASTAAPDGGGGRAGGGGGASESVATSTKNSSVSFGCSHEITISETLAQLDALYEAMEAMRPVGGDSSDYVDAATDQDSRASFAKVDSKASDDADGASPASPSPSPGSKDATYTQRLEAEAAELRETVKKLQQELEDEQDRITSAILLAQETHEKTQLKLTAQIQELTSQLSSHHDCFSRDQHQAAIDAALSSVSSELSQVSSERDHLKDRIQELMQAAAESKGRIETLQDELDARRQPIPGDREYDKMEAELEGVKAQLAESRSQEREYRAQISELETKIKSDTEGTTSSVAKLNAELKTLREELDSAKKEATEASRNAAREKEAARQANARVTAEKDAVEASEKAIRRLREENAALKEAADEAKAESKRLMAALTTAREDMQRLLSGEASEAEEAILAAEAARAELDQKNKDLQDQLESAKHEANANRELESRLEELDAMNKTLQQEAERARRESQAASDKAVDAMAKASAASQASEEMAEAKAEVARLRSALVVEKEASKALRLELAALRGSESVKQPRRLATDSTPALQETESAAATVGRKSVAPPRLPSMLDESGDSFDDSVRSSGDEMVSPLTRNALRRTAGNDSFSSPESGRPQQLPSLSTRPPLSASLNHRTSGGSDTLDAPANLSQRVLEAEVRARAAAQAVEEDKTCLRMPSGREVPIMFCAPELISISHSACTSLLSRNEAALSVVFGEYADGVYLPYEDALRLAQDFDLVRAMCNKGEFRELWNIVTDSEDAQDDDDSCDSEEFVELLVRIAALYGSGDYPLDDPDAVPKCVAALFDRMNNSPPGAVMKTKFDLGPYGASQEEQASEGSLAAPESSPAAAGSPALASPSANVPTSTDSPPISPISADRGDSTVSFGEAALDEDEIQAASQSRSSPTDSTKLNTNPAASSSTVGALPPLGGRPSLSALPAVGGGLPALTTASRRFGDAGGERAASGMLDGSPTNDGAVEGDATPPSRKQPSASGMGAPNAPTEPTLESKSPVKLADRSAEEDGYDDESFVESDISEHLDNSFDEDDSGSFFGEESGTYHSEAEGPAENGAPADDPPRSPPLDDASETPAPPSRVTPNSAFPSSGLPALASAAADVASSSRGGQSPTHATESEAGSPANPTNEGASGGTERSNLANMSASEQTVSNADDDTDANADRGPGGSSAGGADTHGGHLASPPAAAGGISDVDGGNATPTSSTGPNGVERKKTSVSDMEFTLGDDDDDDDDYEDSFASADEAESSKPEGRSFESAGASDRSPPQDPPLGVMSIARRRFDDSDSFEPSDDDDSHMPFGLSAPSAPRVMPAASAGLSSSQLSASSFDDEDDFPSVGSPGASREAMGTADDHSNGGGALSPALSTGDAGDGDGGGTTGQSASSFDGGLDASAASGGADIEKEYVSAIQSWTVDDVCKWVSDEIRAPGAVPMLRAKGVNGSDLFSATNVYLTETVGIKESDATRIMFGVDLLRGGDEETDSDFDDDDDLPF